MRIGRSFGLMSAGFAVIVALGTWPLSAQDGVTKAESKSTSPAATRTYNPSRRVPMYFGQLGLTPEQKESIYAIRGKYRDQLSALEKQITETQAKMMAECETVLSDTQKQLLETRRQAAKQSRKGAGTIKTVKDQPEPSKGEHKPN